jgi:hypothetical protein
MSRDQSPLLGRVLFIVGARRSGTNWLERILTAHPEVVAVPTETYLFSHGVQNFAERVQHANPKAPTMGRTFMPRDAFLDAMRNLVDRVLMETLERKESGARYIVERTPWHASHLPLIADVYPDARVVNIVRDGRAVARSLVSMPWGPETIEEAATEWRKAIDDTRGGQALFGERFLEVSYERLLEQPRPHTKEIFDWLELDLSDGTWDKIILEAGAEFNVDPGSPGVRSDKWRSEVSDADLRVFETVAGEQLELLGYRRAASELKVPSPGRDLRRLLSSDQLRKAQGWLRSLRERERAANERAFSRRLHEDQIRHNETVADFERLIAEGRDDAARALLSPRLSARIQVGTSTREDRGDAAIAHLLETLAEHRDRGIDLVSGEVYATPYGLTTVATYDLADGTRQARTLAYNVRGGRITEVGLHLHECVPAAKAVR